MARFLAADEERTVDDMYSVLLVGVDSTSRLNSIRYLQDARKVMIDKLQVTKCPTGYDILN